MATAVAMVFAAFAGSASAKKMSSKQKAHVRASLLKQVKKNPRVVKRRSFLKRAALVNFVLPVTIRLRNGNCSPVGGGQGACLGAPTAGTALNESGQPYANLDLGPSLGSRQIALSGALSAEVQFHDSYDGGALGNVSLKILSTGAGSSHVLRSSSVPLLWNADVSTQGNGPTRSDVNFARAAIKTGSVPSPGPLDSIAASTQGCGDFKNEAATSSRTYATSTPNGSYSALWYGAGVSASFAAASPGTLGLPGYPVIDPAFSTTSPALFLPVFPGMDDPTRVVGGGYVTADDNNVGPNPSPFPGYGANIAPGSPQYNAAADTVLRTNALTLSIAPAGVTVDGKTGTASAGTTTNTVQGTQSIVTGQSGGEANLFGNIPGKSSAIDVTVNLATSINSILRIVDQDVFASPLVTDRPYPAGIFNCRQVWTGAVQNYIPGVRLSGSLRIAPAITKDGKLRIAKATVSTQQADHVALSACLAPYRSYGTDTGAPRQSTTGFGGQLTPVILGATDPASNPGGTPALVTGTNTAAYNNPFLPISNTPSSAPSTVRCNADPTPLVRNSSLTAPVAPLLAPAVPADGYSTTSDGSAVTVAGDITVPALSVDVVIGDV